MLQRVSIVVLLCFVAVGSAEGQPPADAAASKEAAEHFAQGQRLYAKGQYRDAIASFSRANALAPHPSALFNMARCYENLGDAVKALTHYRKTLEVTREPDSRADIKRRIAHLQSRPVKVFVSSEPAGATVTVGGRERAEPATTPIVVHLRPGAYVLLVQKAGYRLTPHRVEIEPGSSVTVAVKVQPLPAPPPCPPVKVVSRCPQTVDVEALHVNVGVLAGIGLTTGRPLLAAPGIRIYATYRGWLIGGHLLYFPVGESTIDPPVALGASSFDKNEFRWLMAQAEGGWVLPLATAQLELSLGLGASLDRVVFIGREQEGDAGQPKLVREQSAFIWSIGAALQAKVTPWLSVGGSARFGLIHGDRVDREDPGRVDDQHHFPYATFWGTLALHL